MDLDQYLAMLSAVDQEKHISTVPLLDRNDPGFYWIFRNMDYVQWIDGSSQVLWLSGPPECNIHQVSSYIVSQGKDRAQKAKHFVLYFFCSSATRNRSIVTHFVHTLLRQIVYCSPMDKKILIFRSFLRGLLEEAFDENADPTWERRGFNENDPPDTNIKNILKGPAHELLTALGAVLGEEQWSLSLVVDGLDKVERQKEGFIKEVRTFVNLLQQRNSKVKILLTSRPLAEIRDLLDGFPCIEHDKERKGSCTSHFLILN